MCFIENQLPNKRKILIPYIDKKIELLPICIVMRTSRAIYIQICKNYHY